MKEAMSVKEPSSVEELSNEYLSLVAQQLLRDPSGSVVPFQPGELTEVGNGFVFWRGSTRAGLGPRLSLPRWLRWPNPLSLRPATRRSAFIWRWAMT